MKRLFFLFLISALATPAVAQSFEIVWTGGLCATDQDLYPVFILHTTAEPGDGWISLADRWAGGDVSFLTDDTAKVLHPGDLVSVVVLPRDLAGWRDSHPDVFDRWLQAVSNTDGAGNNYYHLQFWANMGMLERWEICYQKERECLLSVSR